jgi:hypothetical protein
VSKLAPAVNWLRPFAKSLSSVNCTVRPPLAKRKICVKPCGLPAPPEARIATVADVAARTVLVEAAVVGEPRERALAM